MRRAAANLVHALARIPRSRGSWLAPLFVVGLATSTMLTGTTARAANTNVPRTPVIHLGESCLEVIDRSQTPSVQLEYTIPSHDTCVGPDEVADSRTHQFVATCRVPDLWTPLPHWLDEEDVEDSIASGALTEAERPPSSDVFSTAEAWADCWAVITPDEARRAIDCETASEGVTWDTTGLPVGAWIVFGYTYQPPFNFWSRRAGVFKVVDSADGAEVPAVGLHPHSEYAGNDGPLVLTACVDAPAGSTLRASFALTDAETPSWTEVSSISLDMNGDVPLELDMASHLDEVEGFLVRVDVETPDGESFTYVSPQEVFYVDGPAPPWSPSPPVDGCEDPDAFEPQTCPGQDDSGDDGGPGCGCRQGPGRPAWLIAVAMLFWRRQRARLGPQPMQGAGPEAGEAENGTVSSVDEVEGAGYELPRIDTIVRVTMQRTGV